MDTDRRNRSLEAARASMQAALEELTQGAAHLQLARQRLLEAVEQLEAAGHPIGALLARRSVRALVNIHRAADAELHRVSTWRAPRRWLS